MDASERHRQDLAFYKKDALQGKILNDEEKRLVHDLRQHVGSRNALAEIIGDYRVTVYPGESRTRVEDFGTLAFLFPGVVSVFKEDKGENWWLIRMYGLTETQSLSGRFDSMGQKERYSEFIVFAKADADRVRLLHENYRKNVEIDEKQGRLMAREGRLLLICDASSIPLKVDSEDFEGKEFSARGYKSYVVPVKSLAETSKGLTTRGELIPYKICPTDDYFGEELKRFFTLDSCWSAAEGANRYIDSMRKAVKSARDLNEEKTLSTRDLNELQSA